MDEVVLRPAVQQLEMLRAGEISITELAEAHIRQIERLNPQLNVFADFDAERVRSEAAAPQQIPFPWRRIALAIVLIAGVLVWCGVELARHGLPEIQTEEFAGSHLPTAMVQPITDAGWVAVALGVSLLSWLLSRRLVGRSGLL